MIKLKRKNHKHNKIITSFSTQIIVLICAAMILSSGINTFVMFVNMRRNAIDTAILDENAYVEKTVQNIINVQEACNTALQIVSHMDLVMEYFEKVQTERDISTNAKIDFYNNNIAAIYNMTNINPNIYQIRLFVNSESVTEKKPCIYRKSRMSYLEWTDNYVDNTWQLDYVDSVFDNSIRNEHIAGIVKTINNSAGAELCVIEVATEMSSLFPDMYNRNDNVWTCFVSDNGETYYDESEIEWLDYLGKIDEIIKNAKKENGVYTQIVNSKHVVISATRIDSLGGSYIHISAIEDILESYYTSQNAYIYVMIISISIFVILVILAIMNMFKQFNELTSTITKIRLGQTDVRIDADGDDEVSELGKQINSMLDHLEKLNAENTSRQLLVKNAEIKSLQNQINAHFMYNVLESIKMMAEIEGEFGISDAITSLGQMFRYSVKWTSGKVALKQEIEYIKNYLALLNLRFDYEIYLALNVPEYLLDCQIPKMSLQPLVENSVLHGIEDMAEDSAIYINAYVKEQNNLYIAVSDAGKGMTEESLNTIKHKLAENSKKEEYTEHGIALKNVQERIKMYYGEDYGVEVYSKLNMYTKVLIKIPYEKENDTNE